MSTLPAANRVEARPNVSVVRTFDARLQRWLRPLGSLKVAVVSFALAIVLILIGTLAQVNRDIWEVLEVYFKTWATWVDAGLFFPRSWYPHLEPGTATRWFVAATLAGGLISGALSWFNAPRIPAARMVACAIMAISFALSISVLLRGGFWFPGGALIGTVMAVNLVSAHVTRYPIRAQRARLAWGVGVVALGILVTALVIISGHNAEGFQGEPPVAWSTLWGGIKVGLTLAGLGLLTYSLFSKSQLRIFRVLCGGLGLILVGLATWLLATGESTYLGDSGMRVLWQLILATTAAVVLLIGSVLLFRQRAGVVVLHAGIALMMFGQWFVTQFDTEEQMTMVEGQTINYGQDIRSVELAVIRRNSPEHPGQDDVHAIPLTLNGYPTRLLKNEKISDASLPFDIEVVEYNKSSTVRIDGSNESPVDSGRNAGFAIAPARPSSGAMESNVDNASGYFQFVDSRTGESLGTYLLSQKVLEMNGGRYRTFDLETVQVGDESYDVQLRFLRNYKDYSLKLIDVRKDDYLGTTIPRNYSSRVQLIDPTRHVDQELTIWMNNPSRYAGETFYQSGYQQDGRGNEYTTLQVVRNYGWMIPYVACMVSIIGMGYHFLLVLLRFLERRGRTGELSGEMQSVETVDRIAEDRPRNWRRGMIPFAVAASFLVLLGFWGSKPRHEAGTMDLYRFGELPLVYQGRVKPFDTLARNSLRVISDIETFKGVLPPSELSEAWPQVERDLKAKYPQLEDEDLTQYSSGDVAGLIDHIVNSTNQDRYAVTQFVDKHLKKRQPAVRWLLDVITGSDNARRHQVIRIYHPQILDVLGLDRRKYYRYSLEEIAPNMGKFEEQVMQADAARQEDVEQLSLYQKKVLETDRKIRMVLMLHRAFSPPSLPELPTAVDFQSDRSAAMAKLEAFREAVFAQDRELQRFQLPLVVAPIETDGEDEEVWQSYTTVWPRQLLAIRVLGQDPQPSFKALNDIMVAYLDQDVDQFNASVDRYHRLLEQQPPDDLKATPSLATTIVSDRFGAFYRFESYFNRCAPFFYCSFLYLAAFVLLCLGWLKWRRGLNQVAYWLLACTFVVHTLALIARIYISGRPPVTNLYSSAIFIGWGVVLLALIIEALYRNGFASLTAAASGFVTLVIAHKLAGDGDTFEVLQAVLDTQFWLATHVVCITLGYATTFLAGLLGIVYILQGVMTPSLDQRNRGELARMMYGTLCFAIFFSFFGTVLGGLWADDSWGRFWGWDPKENGALIIVLWNALILHARWDKMIRDRGLAVLSVAGNIVTAWSWFGVNELGVGLHSYGFTEGRLRTLALAVSVHLLIIAVGWLPLSMWWSYRRQSDMGQ